MAKPRTQPTTTMAVSCGCLYASRNAEVENFPNASVAFHYTRLRSPCGQLSSDRSGCNNTSTSSSSLMRRIHKKRVSQKLPNEC
eukprot:1763730-Pleurochrysis_carterae.AAC.1